MQTYFPEFTQDKLFDFYYQFLSSFNKDITILISVKGGTPQMQTALRVQSISADFHKQIYLEPKLIIADILNGRFSECIRVSYWQYQRVQKYQMTLSLLERWDFDGAVLVLQDWSRNLQSLRDGGVEDSDNRLRKSVDCTKYTVSVLEIAIALFNLDIQSAKNKLKELPDGDELKVFIEENHNISQNLYRQCEVYFKTGQIANFLARLSSFHEFTQIKMIQNLDQNRYFIESNNRYFLKTRLLRENNQPLWEIFWNDYRSICRQNRYSIPNLHQDLKMGNRPIRQSYLVALVSNLNGNSSNPNPSLWSQLDFWYSTRNDLLHGSKGINKDRLNEVWKNRKVSEYKNTCRYDGILDVMHNILMTLADTDTEDYDLYGSIQDAVKAQLNQDLQ